jgi:hypothetical protein
LSSSIEKGSWLKRKAATRVLQEAGVPLTKSTLETIACKGTGPRYQIINGQALYRREWLDEWLLQKSRPKSQGGKP